MEKMLKKEYTGSKPLNGKYQQLFQRKMDEGLNGLVELGTKGHFPLFLPQWIHSLSLNKDEGIKSHPSNGELLNFERILSSLSNYPSLDKKKVLLLTLNDKDRDQFINIFFKMVESKILDQKNYIQ